MATRLPPLNALRTFEAAARHLSFTKAADELFVTQAAVSHQIRTLEEHLGTPLFRRMNRALMLTDEGQALLPAVREAFDRLSAGVRRVLDGAVGDGARPWVMGRGGGWCGRLRARPPSRGEAPRPRGARSGRAFACSGQVSWPSRPPRSARPCPSSSGP